MKVSKNNIKAEKDGYIGTIVEQRFGQKNLLNQCYKNGDLITVSDSESQGDNFFAVDEFCSLYFVVLPGATLIFG